MFFFGGGGWCIADISDVSLSLEQFGVKSVK